MDNDNQSEFVPHEGIIPEAEVEAGIPENDTVDHSPGEDGRSIGDGDDIIADNHAEEAVPDTPDAGIDTAEAIPYATSPVDDGVEDAVLDAREEYVDAGILAPGDGRPEKNATGKGFPTILVLLVVGMFLIATLFGLAGMREFLFGEDDDEEEYGDPTTVQFVWDEPVWLPRNPSCVDPNNGQEFPEYAIGYEPSLAVDSQGNMFYTAHKDLRWCGPLGGPLGVPPGPGPFACAPGFDTTWDYYASWFYASKDGGETWAPPYWGAADAGAWIFPGDEGDIGIDSTDTVYFCDTTLEDNWLHVWRDGGDDYVRGQRQNSLALDDRPWITAQDDGIVHYLGNSGTGLPGPHGEVGRYWYYRSDDGGLTFIEEKELPGGWAHIDAERDGDHVFVIQEVQDASTGDIKMWISHDQGNSWDDAIPLGPRERNPPEGFPWVSVGPDGMVATSWSGVTDNGTWEVHMAVSWDLGDTWANWIVTPFRGAFMYPTVYVGPNNTLAMAFYGLEMGSDGLMHEGDEWHLYAGMMQFPEEGQQFNFTRADPEPLHTVTTAEEQGQDFHALHDFFEIAISPIDLSLNIAYQKNIGQQPFEPGEEQRYLMFVKGNVEEVTEG